MKGKLKCEACGRPLADHRITERCRVVREAYEPVSRRHMYRLGIEPDPVYRGIRQVKDRSIR